MNRPTKTKPRLLYFSDCPTFGGSEKVLLDLFQSDELHERYEVYFVYAESIRYKAEVVTKIDERVRSSGIRILSHQQLMSSSFVSRLPRSMARPLRFLLYRTSANPIYDFINFRTIKRETQRIRPALMHVNNGGWPGARSAFLTCKVAAGRGTSCLLHVHNMAIKKARNPYTLLIDSWAVHSASSIVCVSKAVKESLVNFRRVPPAKTKVISNSAGPKAEVFAQRQAQNVEETSEHQPFVIVSLGSLERRKGFDCLVEAVSLLRKRNIRVHCDIFGTGPLETSLNDLIAQRGLSDSVILHGFEHEGFRVISNADLLVQPAREAESFGLTLVESLLLTTPIVATNVGGMPEVLMDGEFGCLVPPEDPVALAGAIEKLVRSPNLRANLRSAGVVRYWSTYSYESFVRKFLDIYDNLLFENATSH